MVGLITSYLGTSGIAYLMLSSLVDGSKRHAGNTPGEFGDQDGTWPNFNFSAYYMPDYQSVRFPSRQEKIEIDGWYVEAGSDAPAVTTRSRVASHSLALSSVVMCE